MLLHFDETDLEESLREEREEGREEGRIEGRNETLVDSIKKIMKSLKISAEQAMDVLEIPVDCREKYLSML